MTEHRRDEAMEERLAQHYAAERERAPAAAELWATVAPHLGAQERLPWWRRALGAVLAPGQSRVYAGAAAAVGVAVFGAALYAVVVGFGGGDAGQSESAVAVVAPAQESAASGVLAPAPPAAASAPLAGLAMDAAGESGIAASAQAVPGDAVPNTPSVITHDAAAPTDAAPPFRHEVVGEHGGQSRHLFWVALPQGWRATAQADANGAWHGTLTGDGIRLDYTLTAPGSASAAEAAVRGLAGDGSRLWSEFVIGNRAYFAAPAADAAGDLHMALLLPGGVLHATGQQLTPAQQERALGVLRTIIA